MCHSVCFPLLLPGARTTRYLCWSSARTWRRWRRCCRPRGRTTRRTRTPTTSWPSSVRARVQQLSDIGAASGKAAPQIVVAQHHWIPLRTSANLFLTPFPLCLIFFYRGTIQVMPNLPLTSKQKFHFSTRPMYFCLYLKGGFGTC